MIKLKNINKSYSVRSNKSQSVLKNLNVEFESSGFISILGSSGNGKTTLLNIVGGLDTFDSGEYYYNGTQIDDIDEFRRNKVGVVYQEFNLVSHLSALDNVILSLDDNCIDKKEKATSILVDLGLESDLHKKPTELSGGQMQRVAIARMIAKDVDIILCDEPTGSLDSETEEKVVEIIKELSKTKLVLFVTHNRSLAEEYSDRVIELKDGIIFSDDNNITEKEQDLNSNEVSFKQNVLWLAIKNLRGRKKHTLKFLMLSVIIMALGALSIVMRSGMLSDYLHEIRIEEGVRNIVVDIEDTQDDLLEELRELEEVGYAAYNFNHRIKIGLKDGKEGGFSLLTPWGNVAWAEIEEVTDNEFLKNRVTIGRLPQTPHEIVMSEASAIQLLVDTGVADERLQAQFGTGEFTLDYIFGLMDDKQFLIREYGFELMTVVGLIDDSQVYENDIVIYYMDGYIDFFEDWIGLKPDRINIYKYDMTKEAHEKIKSALLSYPGVTINEEHEADIQVEYNKIESFLELSELGLYVILVIAGISYVTLLLGSINERKYEIGLYRTIGYKNGDILKVFMYEMLFISAIALVSVFVVLLIGALFMFNRQYNELSYITILQSMNTLVVLISMVSISVLFTTIVLLITNRRNLNKTIISNIDEL